RTPLVLERGLDQLEAALGADSLELREYLSILTGLRNLPPYVERDPEKIAERHREKEVARDRLARLAETCAPVRVHIDATLAALNGTPGDARSFDGLHALLELQAYRLASWRTAADEINYRRFFDINELAGLRVEEPKVFEEIHVLLLRLIAAGHATGVRLDHIDGLFDPKAYLDQLRIAVDRAHDAASDAPDVPDAGGSSPSGAAAPYIVVEKILSDDEALRADWPVGGTTGYTFLNDVNGVFVDGRRAKAMQRIYARVSGRREPFADVAYESKRLIVSTALSSEFQVLAHAVNRLSEGDRRHRDFTLASIRRALREVVACFPVYRTYLDRAGATPADAAVVDAAIAAARRRNPALEASIFDFLRAVLLPPGATGSPDAPDDDGSKQRLDVAMRFQQYTAPVQAKGVEDTAFYRYHLLASLNEVGGDPGRFGRTVSELHAANGERRLHQPLEMLATTSHDTKRSEDARARINVLSEAPEAWQAAVTRWRKTNAANRTRVAGNQAPDGNDEYLFYQALVGAWPAELLTDDVPDRAAPDLVERMAAYMHKAIKESKLHTSWITPNPEYEAAVAHFVARTLSGRSAPAFCASFVPFVRQVAAAGMINSLAQLVLKIGVPGVADFYQGTELWDLSMVDPDNRRPVDFAARHRLLQALEPWLGIDGTGGPDATAAQTAAVTSMLDTWPDGRIKLFITALGIRLRRAWPDLFLAGSYEPLAVDGSRAAHVVAFARRHGGHALVIVVPRLTTQLPRQGQGRALPLGTGSWEDTTLRLPASLAQCRFRDVITGRPFLPTTDGAGLSRLALADVLESCPVAMLRATPS
ncbi:MAG TPA: malto-oligosyltrehalose synthase, partial [Vicinamibacterales bacterium]|nr:malto-oligosyltrehalose synthase [Vicinamibacterales bacterium]